jgi:hypothetical protein
MAAAITVAAVTTGKTYSCTIPAINSRGAARASAPLSPVIAGSPAFRLGYPAARRCRPDLGEILARRQ